MSALRISRFAVAGILSVIAMFVVAPSALAQYGGGSGCSVGSVTVGANATVTCTAGSGFIPSEIVDVSVGLSGNVSGASYAPAPSGTIKPLGTATLSVESAAYSPRPAQTVTTKGRTNADGSVSLALPTAGLAVGSYTATVTGETSHHSSSASFSIVPAGAAAGAGTAGSTSPATPGTGSGLLAFTGASGVTPLAIGGLALVGVGAGAIVFTRRRKVEA